MTATILLVDDSRASRMLCSSVIRSLRPGLEILEAADANDALALLASQTPQLAVIDMNMPGMSGLELADKLRTSHPAIKLALLTANVQDSIQRRAAELGVRFFRKPITEPVVASILSLLD